MNPALNFIDAGNLNVKPDAIVACFVKLQELIDISILVCGEQLLRDHIKRSKVLWNTLYSN